jgi:chaperonin GroEL
MNQELTTKQRILQGINTLADTVKVTLGTKGRLVMFKDYRDFDDPVGFPSLTKDGVTVAKNVKSKDPVANLAIDVVREASQKTVESSGDGPQPLYAKVLTPEGYVQIGELKVGDIICGTNNSFQEVIGVYPKGKKKVYKVKFSDGREVECSEDHLWTITTNNGTTKTLTVSEMINRGLYLTKSTGDIQYRFFVQNNKVEFNKKELPVDPYLLGLLLGDGSLSGTGDIELSLGKNKKYIIDNINPDLIHSCNYIDERNYFRIKFKDKDLIQSLKDLGLYGTKSSTKFIPNLYLYSDSLHREMLLQGLLDTDGYINNKGLFEYSTVSEQLYKGFLHLVWSLGIPVNHRLHNRLNDLDSYSNTPIYRVAELKGYKYGHKIVEIEETDLETEMVCIKVSNDDHLYVTNDFIVTHNTTTTAVLAQEIINKGYELLKSGVTSYEFNKYADWAVEDIKEYILKNSIEVDNNLELLKRVATISSNDPEVGQLIYDIVQEIGFYGDMDVKQTTNYTTEVHLVKGMKLHKGYFAPFFCNDQSKMEWRANNVHILVFNDTIRDYNDIRPYVQAATSPEGQPYPLLIYCNDVAATALNRIKGSMEFNPRPLMIVEHDGFGDRRTEIINDLCILTGASEVDPSQPANNPYGVLGYAEEVKVDRMFTSILEGNTDVDAVEAEVERIQRRIKESNPSGNEKKFLQKRIANLTGGVAVINVGGKTKVEVKEQYARIEDAVLAVKSAIQKGVSVGGSVTWCRTAFYGFIEGCQKRGIDINNPDEIPSSYRLIFQSLDAVLNQLLINSDDIKSLDAVITNAIDDKNPKGYDLSTREFYDLDDYEVYDATSVLLDSISNAVAVSKSILSIEKVIVDGEVNN